MADKRRLLLLTVGAAVVLSVVSALASWTDPAVAALAVAGLAAFVWIVLWARAVNAAVAGVNRSVARVNRRVKALPSTSDVEDLAKAVRRLQRSLTEVEGRVRAQVRSSTVAVQRIPSATLELGRLYDGIVEHDRPMPELGNWAMSPRTLVWITDHIRTAPVSTIVECGSGSSTVWFATAFEHRGGPGRIVSLESSAEYAEVTRAQLAELGLSHRADVIHAPLVETSMPGREPHPWYDLSVLPDDLDTIDLLFVDGPVGAIAPQVRYPGYPALADRLPAGAVVVLDDTPRRDETRIAEAWLAERPAGRRLTLTAHLDRSMVFTVDIP